MIQSFGILLASLFQVIPIVDVVYPRIAPGDTIPRLDRVDSNFVFGSVQPPDSRLFINNFEVSPQSNGAFLAFLPVNWASQSYSFKALHGDDSLMLFLPFHGKAISPPPLEPLAKPPRLLELTGTPLRTDPRGTYFIFPAKETQVVSTLWQGGYYRIPLPGGTTAWVESRGVRDLGPAPKPSSSAVLWRLELDTLEGGVVITAPLDRKVLCYSRDESDPRRIVVDLFGVISHLDKISYPPATKFVREIYWEQSRDSVLSLDIRLNAPLWGYRFIWQEKGLTIVLNPAPEGKGLHGLKIALDPGHGGDQDGAIGPSRVKEKEVNLLCAQALAKKMERAGATVLLTRTVDVTLSLPDRIDKAEQFGAHLFVSLHHNALPDGVNPFQPFGTGVYYYRPQSRDFALAIQEEVVEVLDLPDEGIYYNDLAVVRPTSFPSVLIESAYIIKPEQESLIADPDYPDRLAGAILKGISKCLEQRKRER